MQTTKELFVIPHEGNFILYAPLKRAVAEANGDMIHLLKRLNAGEDIGDLERKLDPLRKIGIVMDEEDSVVDCAPKKEFYPTSVTLIPSLDCNLRCVYCYSAAGESVGKTMDLEVAKSAIDLIIKNSLVQEEEQVELGFHGGGEPLLGKNMGLIKGAVEYFRTSP